MNMDYETERQKIVVEAQLQDGYELLGASKPSYVNGLKVFVVVKGRHTMAINSLGYDEHVPGRTYKLL